jgi:hypothetical protein
MPARLILLLMQIHSLRASQLTIRLVRALELTNVTLLTRQRTGLTTSELAGPRALLDTLMLILLALIDARIASAGLRLTQPGDTQHPSNQQGQADTAALVLISTLHRLAPRKKDQFNLLTSLTTHRPPPG